MKNEKSQNGAANAVLKVVRVIATSGKGGGHDIEAARILQDLGFIHLKDIGRGVSADAPQQDYIFLIEYEASNPGNQKPFRLIRMEGGACHEAESGRTMYVQEVPDDKGIVEIMVRGDIISGWQFYCAAIVPEILAAYRLISRTKGIEPLKSLLPARTSREEEIDKLGSPDPPSRSAGTLPPDLKQPAKPKVPKSETLEPALTPTPPPPAAPIPPPTVPLHIPEVQTPTLCAEVMEPTTARRRLDTPKQRPQPQKPTERIVIRIPMKPKIQPTDDQKLVEWVVKEFCKRSNISIDDFMTGPAREHAHVRQAVTAVLKDKFDQSNQIIAPATGTVSVPYVYTMCAAGRKLIQGTGPLAKIAKAVSRDGAEKFSSNGSDPDNGRRKTLPSAHPAPASNGTLEDKFLEALTIHILLRVKVCTPEDITKGVPEMTQERIAQAIGEVSLHYGDGLDNVNALLKKMAVVIA